MRQQRHASSHPLQPMQSRLLRFQFLLRLLCPRCLRRASTLLVPRKLPLRLLWPRVRHLRRTRLITSLMAARPRLAQRIRRATRRTPHCRPTVPMSMSMRVRMPAGRVLLRRFGRFNGGRPNRDRDRRRPRQVAVHLESPRNIPDMPQHIVEPVHDGQHVAVRVERVRAFQTLPFRRAVAVPFRAPRCRAARHPVKQSTARLCRIAVLSFTRCLVVLQLSGAFSRTADCIPNFPHPEILPNYRHPVENTNSRVEKSIILQCRPGMKRLFSKFVPIFRKYFVIVFTFCIVPAWLLWCAGQGRRVVGCGQTIAEVDRPTQGIESINCEGLF